jgi:hypothetical protein
MMKKETRENIYLHPRWFVEVDLNYLKINKDKIINFKRYNYLDRDEAVLDMLYAEHEARMNAANSYDNDASSYGEMI